MTIDEAIEKARNNAVIQRNNQKLNYMLGKSSPYYNLNCDKYPDYHEQIAEWSEELKMLRELKAAHRKIGNIEGFNKGYDKAIDEFAEKLKAKCDGIIKDKWNSNVAPVSWAEAYADFKDDIDEISEQLKAGGENDNLRR